MKEYYIISKHNDIVIKIKKKTRPLKRILRIEGGPKVWTHKKCHGF